MAGSQEGVVITMNVFIDPSNKEEYLKHAIPVAKQFRSNPKNTFTEVSVDPSDAGHIRIVQGWTENSEWWAKAFLNEPWFEEFLSIVKPLWVKPRVIEHFNRVALD